MSIELKFFVVPPSKLRFTMIMEFKTAIVKDVCNIMCEKVQEYAAQTKRRFCQIYKNGCGGQVCDVIIWRHEKTPIGELTVQSLVHKKTNSTYEDGVYTPPKITKTARRQAVTLHTKEALASFLHHGITDDSYLGEGGGQIVFHEASEPLPFVTRWIDWEESPNLIERFCFYRDTIFDEEGDGEETLETEAAFEKRQQNVISYIWNIIAMD